MPPQAVLLFGCLHRRPQLLQLRCRRLSSTVAVVDTTILEEQTRGWPAVGDAARMERCYSRAAVSAADSPLGAVEACCL